MQGLYKGVQVLEFHGISWIEFKNAVELLGEKKGLGLAGGRKYPIRKGCFHNI